MKQGIRKESKKARDGKGFYLNMRTCRPEIALSCMTEHEPLPHTRFVYACVCLEFNGYNVQVRLCVLIRRIFAISVYELCLCVCLGAGGGACICCMGMCEFARGIVPPVKGEVVHQRFLRGLSVQMEKAH